MKKDYSYLKKSYPDKITLEQLCVYCPMLELNMYPPWPFWQEDNLQLQRYGYCRNYIHKSSRTLLHSASVFRFLLRISVL